MGLFDFNNFNSNQAVELVKDKINDTGIEVSNLRVALQGAVVVVSGEVETDEEKAKISRILKAISATVATSNQLTVADGDYDEEEDGDYEEGDEEEYDEEEGDAGLGSIEKLSGEQIQVILEALGYELGSIDGIVGAKTKQAVKGFQEDYDLGVDGIVGPKTTAALVSAFMDDVEDVNGVILQLMLRGAGYNPGKVDGVVGPNTKNALRSFQEEYELDVNGRLDEDTLHALKEAYLTA